ncbi:MAG: DNA methyltransferase [Rhodospirillales bacterium]|jgi:DNA adenine methylase|uniref:DNA adenine methylase n=1 Tax=Hwanghaeella sp. 1Z406 TaxID=3402811 RepID=UPI000C8D26CC|nr:DNA methyltransferase [Rhodospirillales bacterium]|tara:strand:- start:2103 stop:2990 length:888 start_codon:yes stop_codon:yes gene_type:complete
MTQKSQYYSPLRYPGGKGKLFKFVKDLIIHNGLDGGSYSEPYAGGASIALGLLIEDYVSEIHINDSDASIFSFWRAILRQPDEFIKRVWDTPVTTDEWKKQKAIQAHKDSHDYLDIGFSTFFLNRTNRSGILKAGVIGGNDQLGNYKIDARYNKEELVRRINTIANHSKSIKIYGQDALKFITQTIPRKETKGLVFLDPPYYVQGKRLYTSFYDHRDHVKVAEAIKKSILKYWIVTYDNADQINEIYDLNNKIVYNLRYSVSHSSPIGSEVLFYSDHITLPHQNISKSHIESEPK